jgi:threonine aldolase
LLIRAWLGDVQAAAHLGVDVRELTCKADSITVCVSKGLGAPAGSLLIGNRAFVEKVSGFPIIT